jgi:uncharacterized protein (TIGR01777 family)
MNIQEITSPIKRTHRESARDRVVIFGGAGFVGQALQEIFVSAGMLVLVVDRAPVRGHKGVESLVCDISKGLPEDDRFKNALAWINLAGASIAGEFTPEHKKLIYDSRIDSTKVIAETLVSIRKNHRPSVFIQASAIGIYKPMDGILLDEDAQVDETFLAKVVVDWEKEILPIASAGIRVVIARQAHVVGSGGIAKAFSQKLPKTASYLGRKGTWFSWVSLNDLAEFYLRAAEDSTFAGIYNLAAPRAIFLDDFIRYVARKDSKKIFGRVPAFILNLKLGKEFTQMLLESKRITPARLLAKGYQFADKVFPGL